MRTAICAALLVWTGAWAEAGPVYLRVLTPGTSQGPAAPSLEAVTTCLDLFNTQPPGTALGLLLEQRADHAAALVLKAVAAPGLDDRARLGLLEPVGLGEEALSQVATLAEALPRLAQHDEGLARMLSQAQGVLSENAPSVFEDPGLALFDGGGAPAGPRLSLETKVRVLKAGHVLKRATAGLYRPLLYLGKSVLSKSGRAYRAATKGEMDPHRSRWEETEHLYQHGRTRPRPGREPSGSPAAAVLDLRAQSHRIGEVEISPMVGLSGMSFPQISAQSHLSLLYIHLKMAKEHGVRMLHNTGEGGPRLHLALLDGDREALKEEVVQWNLERKQFGQASWEHAKVVRFLESLMASRDALFKEFTPEDLARAQIVAQFGSALNGIRGPEMTVDYDKLARIGRSPFVKMVQFKLKQAAKRGAKIDPSKIDPTVAAFRDTPRGKPFKSPELIPSMSSFEEIATLLRRTREVTGKPVSLKFAVGDARDILGFLEYLRDHDILPDHIQLDGRGDDFSPGSGNAPPVANTSLPINEATVVVDAVMKHLGIRDRILLDASGDILEPEDALERLALGADGVVGARCWMGLGLGCSQVRECAKGKCPYGIAAKSDSLAGLALDPLLVGPRGYRGGVGFWETMTQLLANRTGDWRRMRFEHGLAAADSQVRIRVGKHSHRLDEIYDLDYVANLLRGAMTKDEVHRVVFGGRPAVPGLPVVLPQEAQEGPGRRGERSSVLSAERRPPGARPGWDGEPGRTAGTLAAALGGWVRLKEALAGVPERLPSALRASALSAVHHAWEIHRHYIRARDAVRNVFRWKVDENLHEEEDFRGSFGHPVHEGLAEVMSPLIFPEAAYKAIRWQKKTIGRGETAIELSPAVGFAGMPFDSLSVQDHLALLYAHIKLASDRGGRTLFNTGEGGWEFYRALLARDRGRLVEALKGSAARRLGAWDRARVLQFADLAVELARRILGEFTEEDLRHVQYVAQFRDGLTAEQIRGLREDPTVAIVQYNLDADLSEPAEVSRLVRRTRQLTGKPVSLRIEVTDARSLHRLLAELQDGAALPDHLQIEGRGPGSSGGERTMPINEALIVADAILRSLDARESVFIEATGDVRLPVEAIEKLILGADGVSSGKAWVAVAAGSHERDTVGALSDRDILDLSASWRKLAADPVEEGRKGFLASANFSKALVQTLAETGAQDWRRLRETAGLASEHPVLRVKAGSRVVTYDLVYTPEKVSKLLEGVMSRSDVERLVFGRGPGPQPRN